MAGGQCSEQVCPAWRSSEFVPLTPRGECGGLEAGWGPPALNSGHTPWGSSSFFASDLVSLLTSGTAGFLTQEMMTVTLHRDFVKCILDEIMYFSPGLVPNT